MGVLLNLTGVVSLLGNATLPKYQWGSKSTKNFQTWFIEANFDIWSSRAQEDAKKYIFLKSNVRYQNGKPLAIQRSSVKVKLSSYFLTGAFQKKTKQNETPCNRF